MERRRPIDRTRDTNDRRYQRIDRRSCLERRHVGDRGAERRGERRGSHNTRRFSPSYWLSFFYHLSLGVERRIGDERREYFDRRMQTRRDRHGENYSAESVLTREEINFILSHS